MRKLRRYAAVALAAVAVAACAPSRASTNANGEMTVLGETAALGLGIATPYVIVDKKGDPVEIGVRLTEKALDGLPQGDAPSMYVLEFPEEAAKTPVKNLMLNWYPKGRKPAELFGEPQLAFHFYTIDHNEAMGINPKAEPAKASRLLDPKYVAKDFIAEPGDPVEKTVPSMGLHWLDSTREFGPGKPEFSEVFVYGSFDAKMIFLEPLATRKYLLTKPQLTADVKQPESVQKDGFYPTKYSIRWDDKLQSYVISLANLTKRQGS
ncbi:hypothetical protein Lesp02_84800 [Lentzea sp. NBRC 105346]|uniref:DUF5602 domain-containing protein n=1 Tax=Lentzea sp. NBRC 105346 TaxID=3032205 RepID=UPI0024A501F4|nr:DUF5602 domain-containing protein [Lentzea sp. NBRC 105346]GLZ36293.1 hypothetical protein Lesp02_84800 [Lentzea sp. NBRC 105346]